MLNIDDLPKLVASGGLTSGQLRLGPFPPTSTRITDRLGPKRLPCAAGGETSQKWVPRSELAGLGDLRGG
jgi:hypothetical protein